MGCVSVVSAENGVRLVCGFLSRKSYLDSHNTHTYNLRNGDESDGGGESKEDDDGGESTPK